MEADLDRFYNRDLRDLWRRDRHGRRLLTLRMVYVRVTQLPRESALALDANNGRTPWSLTDHLIADLWTLQARQGMGKKAPRQLDHPRRPKGSPQPVTPERAARLQKARRRRAEIRRRRQREEE
ncbi:hypothetical protein [Nocardia neocaledoniensis]|uniref:hypothetical protein n=1 Tax=Nocardia neocaledoniensis TaxID=236511 RepID=UPI0024578640|nr:hypothetical protein [Nocardia neocaledoniensis]